MYFQTYKKENITTKQNSINYVLLISNYSENVPRTHQKMLKLRGLKEHSLLLISQ